MAQCYIRGMNFDEACPMHLTPNVVHNFAKVVVVSHGQIFLDPIEKSRGQLQ